MNTALFCPRNFITCSNTTWLTTIEEQGSMKCNTSHFFKAAICHLYTHSSAVRVQYTGKKTHGTGSVPNVVLISQPLNAPFLSSTLFCFYRMSFLIAYYVVFAENRKLIFSPCVLGEVLLMCALGVRMLDHIFTIWRSIVPADTEILMTPRCTTLSLTHASLSQDTSQDVWSLFSQCGRDAERTFTFTWL